jgi:hypothetical protein
LVKRKITKQTETIDVEATEITEDQIMLLSDQTGKLSKKEMDTLEQYFGFDRDSKKNDPFKLAKVYELKDQILSVLNEIETFIDGINDDKVAV